MKKVLMALCFAAPWLAAAPAQAAVPVTAAGIHFAGGDGSSVEKAVVILGATESTGTRAEYLWLDSHYPGWQSHDQSLLNQGHRVYDVMSFTMPDGSRHNVYFDITDYFGKY